MPVKHTCRRCDAPCSGPGKTGLCLRCSAKARRKVNYRTIREQALDLGSYSAAARAVGVSRQLVMTVCRSAGITQQRLRARRRELRKVQGPRCSECGGLRSRRNKTGLCARCSKRSQRGTMKYDLTGQRIGHLRVVALTWNDEMQRSTWLCVCDCGRTKELTGQPLYKKRIKTCGRCNPKVGTLYYRIQRFVRDHGPCCVRQIGKHTGRPVNSTSGHLYRMVGRGILVGVPGGPRGGFLYSVKNGEHK